MRVRRNGDIKRSYLKNDINDLNIPVNPQTEIQVLHLTTPVCVCACVRACICMCVLIEF